MEEKSCRIVRILCPKLLVTSKYHLDSGIQWLIGSPFLPSVTIVSTFRCIHTHPNSSSPDYVRESDDLRILLLRGFYVIGALVTGSSDFETKAKKAIDASLKLSDHLYRGKSEKREVIGAIADKYNGHIQFFISTNEESATLESVTSVVYEEDPEKYLWENGCLLRCELPIKLPMYFPVRSLPDGEKIFLRSIELLTAKLRDPEAAYMVESSSNSLTEAPHPVILRRLEFDNNDDLSSVKLLDEGVQGSDPKLLPCGNFSFKSKTGSVLENADAIQVTVLLSKSEKGLDSCAPIAEYIPASDEARIVLVKFRLEVLCYVDTKLPLMHAVSKLVVPGITDQLNKMKDMVLPDLFTQHPQLHPYHFKPPGFLHPISVIYELSYGETEMKQVEIRKSLHSRLGLPLDRPLLRIANALDLSHNIKPGSSLTRKGSSLLKDVHTGIPSSGVSGGFVSLVQGSYEYHHYLQEGFNDSGWGCAYRSLQTIISWFRLQHYSSIDVPSHREIQEALVEIGDKDASFIGSREWIGAIELSFVLDKLLGVSCKVINVRSGAELPEKCRELASHFENQGTPIMIGGGVLAYTLLGVDYNDASGDCAFLILDPHYTGSDELKKIVNGGWCGWKNAVDSKGKNFFLQDKFYNLLLPQRPNMV